MTCIRKRAPAASSPFVRKVMQRNVGHTTGIEARLQAALKADGARFKIDRKLEPGMRWKADIVFVTEKLCVFVDGCFWHGCPVHFKSPRTHGAWWTEKIQANVDRDFHQNTVLAGKGWTVLRFWEHDLLDNLSVCVRKVMRALKNRRAQTTGLQP